MEEEDVQTAVGLTLRGQSSWETAGQYEDESSMSRLGKPEPHVSWSKAADRVMGGESVKGSKLKATKSQTKGERGQSSPEESESSFMHRYIVSVDLTVGV